MKQVLRVSNILLTTCLLTLGWQDAPTQLSATFLFACMGVSWATTISVLWMVVSLTCKRRGLTNPGLYNGLFNLSMCCPQIVISLIGVVIFSDGGNDATIFLVGAAGAFIALILVSIVIVPDEADAEHALLRDDVPRAGRSSMELEGVPKSRRGYSVSYQIDHPQPYGTMLPRE